MAKKKNFGVCRMNKLITSLLLATGLMTATAANATVIFEDNFDTDTTSNALNFTSLNNWDVTTGTVDYIIDPVGTSFQSAMALRNANIKNTNNRNALFSFHNLFNHSLMTRIPSLG
jgi:hypothetical protein